MLDVWTWIVCPQSFSFCISGPFDSARVNRSALTSPNPTPLPLRSINHRVFHFFMRVREPPKRILRVFVQFQFILPTKKNKTKQKTSIQKYAEAMWGGSPKTTIRLTSRPLFVRLGSNRFLDFGSVGRWGEKKSQEIWEQEAWNTSIIAVEPENNKTWSPNRHKLNMAENVVSFHKQQKYFCLQPSPHL